MPLPAALQARLEKRGIVKQQQNRKPVQHGHIGGIEPVEEVFAEDYDEPGRPGPLLVAEIPRVVAALPVVPEPVMEEEPEPEVLACPNKWNPYHECGDYCRKKWGIKTFNPDPDMTRKRDRMLRRFPLPENWEEVPDPETSRYYYWNRHTDEVSWLSPLHPKAHITLAAKAIKEMLVKSTVKSKVDIQETKDRIPDIDDDIDFERMEEDLQREEKERKKRDRRGRRRKEEELDPMDPASYSDVARGSWSAGLERHGEAKTGVDVTASGPLFQQRPYPSPGDILRANRKAPE